MRTYLYRLLTLLLLAALLLSGCTGKGGEEETTASPAADVLFVVDNEPYALFSEGGVPQAPAKQGFRFVGWYRDKGKWEQPVDVSAWSGKSVAEVLSLLSWTDGTSLSLFAKFVEIPPEGYLPGYLCPSRDVSLFDGEHDADTVNVQTAKKVTVINFWGTWCGPCKAELPHFDELAREYGDRIVMIAVHSHQDVSDAPEYIAEHYADSPILFGYDDARDSCFFALGGYGSYPMTLVLDEEGVVIANRTGALTKTELQALIETALGN